MEKLQTSSQKRGGNCTNAYIVSVFDQRMPPGALLDAARFTHLSRCWNGLLFDVIGEHLYECSGRHSAEHLVVGAEPSPEAVWWVAVGSTHVHGPAWSRAGTRMVVYIRPVRGQRR